MKGWLALVALTSASADVAFRWPDGMISAFASLIFWYLLFIIAAIGVMKIVDRSQRRVPLHVMPDLIRHPPSSFSHWRRRRWTPDQVRGDGACERRALYS